GRKRRHDSEEGAPSYLKQTLELFLRGPMWRLRMCSLLEVVMWIGSAISLQLVADGAYERIVTFGEEDFARVVASMILLPLCLGGAALTRRIKAFYKDSLSNRAYVALSCQLIDRVQSHMTPSLLGGDTPSVLRLLFNDVQVVKRFMKGKAEKARQSLFSESVESLQSIRMQSLEDDVLSQLGLLWRKEGKIVAKTRLRGGFARGGVSALEAVLMLVSVSVFVSVYGDFQAWITPGAAGALYLIVSAVRRPLAALSPRRHLAKAYTQSLQRLQLFFSVTDSLPPAALSGHATNPPSRPLREREGRRGRERGRKGPIRVTAEGEVGAASMGGEMGAIGVFPGVGSVADSMRPQREEDSEEEREDSAISETSESSEDIGRSGAKKGTLALRRGREREAEREIVLDIRQSRAGVDPTNRNPIACGFDLTVRKGDRVGIVVGENTKLTHREVIMSLTGEYSLTAGPSGGGTDLGDPRTRELAMERERSREREGGWESQWARGMLGSPTASGSRPSSQYHRVTSESMRDSSASHYVGKSSVVVNPANPYILPGTVLENVCMGPASLEGMDIVTQIGRKLHPHLHVRDRRDIADPIDRTTIQLARTLCHRPDLVIVKAGDGFSREILKRLQAGHSIGLVIVGTKAEIEAELKETGGTDASDSSYTGGTGGEGEREWRFLDFMESRVRLPLSLSLARKSSMSVLRLAPVSMEPEYKSVLSLHVTEDPPLYSRPTSMHCLTGSVEGGDGHESIASILAKHEEAEREREREVQRGVIARRRKGLYGELSLGHDDDHTVPMRGYRGQTREERRRQKEEARRLKQLEWERKDHAKKVAAGPSFSSAFNLSSTLEIVLIVGIVLSLALTTVEALKQLSEWSLPPGESESITVYMASFQGYMIVVGLLFLARDVTISMTGVSYARSVYKRLVRSTFFASLDSYCTGGGDPDASKPERTVRGIPIRILRFVSEDIAENLGRGPGPAYSVIIAVSRAAITAYLIIESLPFWRTASLLMNLRNSLLFAGPITILMAIPLYIASNTAHKK
ncbi:hypothetical protein KIPB_005766, partial [Kipferlia bialata]